MLAGGAVATCTVCCVEDRWIDDRVGPRNLRAGLWFSRKSRTAAHHKQHSERGYEEQTVVSHRRSSSASRGIPCASMPARNAKGRFSDVQTLLRRTTIK